MFTLIFESCPHRESKSKTRCYMHISIATKKMFPFIKDVETFDMHTELSMYIVNYNETLTGYLYISLRVDIDRANNSTCFPILDFTRCCTHLK